MIHTIGDSHSFIPFQNIPNVTTHWLGPVTLKRLGHPEENLLIDTIKSFNPPPQDTLLFAAGEIDVRCWVNVYITQRKFELEDFQDWVTLYLDKIALLSPWKIAIMGIPPPAPKLQMDREAFPVAGTDQERVEYTRFMNSSLEFGSKMRNFAFLDVSCYEDQNGMLNPILGDGMVHICDNTLLLKAINNLGLR